MEKRYLGDSVYAEMEDDMIKLTTNNRYPDDPRNIIFLEKEVFRSLVNYAISNDFQTKNK